MTDIDIDQRPGVSDGSAGTSNSGAGEAQVWEALASGHTRTRPARNAPGLGRDRGTSPDALDQYVRSLRGPAVLTREQTYELATVMDDARRQFLAELYAVSATAIRIVERWRGRQASGHVTAALSAHYRDGSGRDWSSTVDAALEEVERLLERRVRLARSARRSSTRELERLDARIAQAVEAAEISFEVTHSIWKELGELRRGPRSREALEERRRLGLSEPATRRRLERAARSLESYEKAKQTFVVHNLRLVIKQAKRFRNMGVPYLDLIQEGNLGLIRAVEKFDHTLGYKFSTYAVWWIEQALVRAVQNVSRTVRVPTHVYDLQIRLGKVRERLRTMLGRAPSYEELGEALGVSPQEVERVVVAMRPIASTHSVLPGTEDFTLEDVLADEDAPDAVDVVDRGQLRRVLSEKLAALDQRDREILEARFGLSGAAPLTLQEIGAQLGLSRERVRQLEARALARLREEAAADGLEASLDLAC